MLNENKIKLCFIGNPNVGKSTLINRLLNSNDLQTSELPGTTKKIIEKKLVWKEKEFIFLDTAGVYKKKDFNFNLLVKATRLSKIIILILDSSIKRLDKIHKKLVSHTLKAGKGLIIIFNKWDLINNKKEKKKELEEFIKYSVPQFDKRKLFFISALRDNNFLDILKFLNVHDYNIIILGKEKEYILTFVEPITSELIRGFESGIELSEGFAKADLLDQLSDTSLRVIIHQGWNRQLRRMAARYNYKIHRLIRTRIGHFTVDGLNPGEWKEISGRQINR